MRSFSKVAVIGAVAVLAGIASVSPVTGSLAAGTATATRGVTWMHSYRAPGTPGRYDWVGVVKTGRPSARNVLVLEPGTSAGAAYFLPLARWIVSRAPNWQVWSVERRENLLGDYLMLNRAKEGKATANQLFGYYLGHLTDPSIKHHIVPVPDSRVGFARQWGLNVAIQDLHTVIRAASKLHGKVVLGGHSLGGSVVTAYATWNFGGKPGADQLAGLVYDDGGSFAAPESAAAASAALQTLATSTPWLAFSGVPALYLGLYSAVGSTVALLAPNQPSLTVTFDTTAPAPLDHRHRSSPPRPRPRAQTAREPPTRSTPSATPPAPGRSSRRRDSPSPPRQTGKLLPVLVLGKEGERFF